MKLDRELRGGRIVVRSYRKADLPFLTGMWFDAENGKYMSDPTAEYVDEVYRDILDDLENSTDGYYLVAELADTGEPVASAGIFPVGEGTYDIGYCVHRRFWRQGYGSEIVSLLLGWLREHGAKKVTAEVAVENTASNRLLQKFGFVVERKSRFSKYRMDVHFDSVIYAKALCATDE